MPLQQQFVLKMLPSYLTVTDCLDLDLFFGAKVKANYKGIIYVKALSIIIRSYSHCSRFFFFSKFFIGP